MPDIFLDEDDICIYVTEECNSNCIMCPMSEASRRRGQKLSSAQWESIPNVIPKGAPHITITGGEPFLEHEALIPALELIVREYTNTEILILTNGRALSIKRIFKRIAPFLSERVTLAVPIHGPDAALHDMITQSPGSFKQSIMALEMLAETPVKIEVRIVGHHFNQFLITDTIRMLTDKCFRITTINIIAMEMTGCAARNRKELWVDYDELCQLSEPGIRFAIENGINVGLYNFPLCMVPHRLWPIAKNSISPAKIRHDEKCRLCSELQSCGGLFYSTFELGLCRVRPL